MSKSIRRVVSGLDERGRSVWTSDSRPQSYKDFEPFGVRVTDIWNMPKIPPDVRADHAPNAFEHWPAKGGLVFRLAEIPPMTSVNARDAVRAGPALMHKSDTVDLMVIISGEIWGLQNDTEEALLLKQGDTLIQRGTMHAWENRSNEPCVYAVVLVGANV
jgi:hypothetical protein